MRIFCRKIRLYSIHVKLVEFKRRWYVCTKFLATKSIDRLRINAWIRQLYWIGGKWEISDKLINYSAFHRLFLFLILFNDMCQVLQHAFSTHWLDLNLNDKWPGVASDGNFNLYLIRKSGYGWLFPFPVGRIWKLYYLFTFIHLNNHMDGARGTLWIKFTKDYS